MKTFGSANILLSLGFLFSYLSYTLDYNSSQCGYFKQKIAFEIFVRLAYNKRSDKRYEYDTKFSEYESHFKIKIILTFINNIK